MAIDPGHPPLDPARAFLGVGWAFPPALQKDGAVAEVAYDLDVQQAIWIILGTNPGERVMRPDFGAGLRDFVFEPVTTTTMARLRQRVQESLVAWEPRIDVERVTVSRTGERVGAVAIDIAYRVRVTNTRHNLVYPFYLAEGTPA